MNDITTNRAWAWPIVLGIILIIIGFIAAAIPYFTTITSIYFLGWLLVFGGLAQLVYSFVNRASTSFLLHALLGLLSIVVGVLIILYPHVTAMTLTLLLAAFFLALGLFRISTALILRFPNWGWFLFGGILAFVLGILILIHWPTSAFWVIGLFIGIDFIFLGWSFLLMGMMLKRLNPPA